MPTNSTLRQRFNNRDILFVTFVRALPVGLLSSYLPRFDADHAGVEIDATTLSLILNGVELAGARRRQRYSRPSPAASVEPARCRPTSDWSFAGTSRSR